MPLPAPVERTSAHTRRIHCEGFARADGLYEVDAWLIDTKGFEVTSTDQRKIPVGQPIHDMGLRITFDRGLIIREVVAVMDEKPTLQCAEVPPNFAKLVGLKLSSGFNREARTVIERTQGCTHLLDLLGPVATTAFQVVAAKNFRTTLPKDMSKPPPIVNSCRGWARDSPLVKEVFPQFYTGKD